MSATPKETKPDFDEEFLQTLSQWKEKNKIRDDDWHKLPALPKPVWARQGILLLVLAFRHLF
jgi:hypothetical protein